MMRMLDSEDANAVHVRLSALEHGYDAVFIVGTDRRVFYFNHAAEAIWMMDRSEVIGRDVCCLGFDDLINKDVVPPLLKQQHDNAQQRASVETTIARKDGRIIHADVSLADIQFGGRDCRVAFVRDKNVEVGLQKCVSLLTSMADSSERVVLVTNGQLEIIYANAAFTTTFGYSVDEAKGQPANVLLTGRYTNRRTLASLRRSIGKDNCADLLLYDRLGDEIWVSAIVRPMQSDGSLDRLVIILSDISDTKQLRSLERLTMSALADEIPIAHIADRLCRMVEVIAPDVVSSLLHVDSKGALHPLGGPSLPKDYSSALDGVMIGPEIGSCGTAAFFGEPVLAIDIDTDPRWQTFKSRPIEVGLRACWSSPIKAKDGRVIGTFAFYFRECRPPSRWHQKIVDACVYLGSLAIERKEAQAEIARLAYYDVLTGLPNRARLSHLIIESVKACPSGMTVALAFIDIDNFKDVNDRLGHSAGDEVLVEFAERLRAQIESGDMLGRLGGDEFVMVLPNRDTQGAARVASRIARALAVPYLIGSTRVSISASIGISFYPDNATDIDTLTKQADAAMYQAKRAGRATYRFFSPEMNSSAEERMIYTAALRGAVESDALTLYYQPQIRTADGSIYGVEALARWHDPVLGIVSPAKFIPLAEECGLIEQIGLWSVRAACRQMVEWHNAGLDIPCVSVNLSPINFHNADLALAVEDILSECGLAPEALMLEVTEGVVQNERSLEIEAMTALRELGVGLSLDDFGTGYSSLSRLAYLPIRELKIDRSFMQDLDTVPRTRAVVTSVVRVGQGLQLSVVAEGVETEGQLKFLTDLGCDVVQGFFYAPALSPQAFGPWLLDYRARRAGVKLRQIRETMQYASGMNNVRAGDIQAPDPIDDARGISAMAFDAG